MAELLERWLEWRPTVRLRQAVAWGWIGHNPAKQATAPSAQKADVQPPEPEDATRLLSAAMAESPELGLFLRAAVVLGARRGEIISLRWSDIDLDRGEVLIAGNVVRVPTEALLATPTKPHAKRRVAIGTGTVELLRSRRECARTRTAWSQACCALVGNIAIPRPLGPRPVHLQVHPTPATTNPEGFRSTLVRVNEAAPGPIHASGHRSPTMPPRRPAQRPSPCWPGGQEAGPRQSRQTTVRSSARSPARWAITSPTTSRATS
jgi:integrase